MAKNKVGMAARRWGKSRYLLFEMLKCYVDALSVAVPESVVPPFHAWLVLPSFPQARQLWSEMMAFIPEEFRLPGGVHQESMLMYLVGDDAGHRDWGLVEVKSAHDPDALQTVGLDFLGVDEAQDVQQRAFERLLPTLRSPDRMGRGVYLGIPPLTTEHWFFRLYRAAEAGRGDYYCWTATYRDNPLLTKTQRDEIEGDREFLPQASWERYYLARYSELAAYFGGARRCVAGDMMSGALPGRQYVAGLDLGRKVDATVLDVMDAEERRLVHRRVWDAGEGWVQQREGVFACCKEWGVNRLIVDATGLGDVFVDELQAMGAPVEPFVISSATRDGLLKDLAVAIERETVHFPDVPNLLRQLLAFGHRKLPSGNYRLEVPPGEHDDEVFSLALALQACQPATGVRPMNWLTGGSIRYLPTQEEAQSGGMKSNFGARFMRERHLEKLRQRQELPVYQRN